jgi:hypothetical protein
MDTFIVRFSDNYFFTGRQDGNPAGVLSPSMAKFLTYDGAILIVQALHQLGYEDAVVCTTRGWVVMPEDFQQEDSSAEEEFLTAWGAEPTVEVISALEETEQQDQ